MTLNFKFIIFVLGYPRRNFSRGFHHSHGAGHSSYRREYEEAPFYNEEDYYYDSNHGYPQGGPEEAYYEPDENRYQPRVKPPRNPENLSELQCVSKSIHVYRQARKEVPKELLDLQEKLRQAKNLEANEYSDKARPRTRPLMEQNRGGEPQKNRVESPPKRSASPELEVVAVKSAPKAVEKRPPTPTGSGGPVAKKAKVEIQPPPLPPKKKETLAESKIEPKAFWVTAEEWKKVLSSTVKEAMEEALLPFQRSLETKIASNASFVEKAYIQHGKRLIEISAELLRNRKTLREKIRTVSEDSTVELKSRMTTVIEATSRLLDQNSDRVIKYINTRCNIINVPGHNVATIEASLPAEDVPRPDDDGVELISHYGGSECSDEYRPTDREGNPEVLDPAEENSDTELDAQISELFPSGIDLPVNPQAGAASEDPVATAPCEGMLALQNAVAPEPPAAPENPTPAEPNPVDIVERAMAAIEEPASTTSTRRSRRAGQL